MLQNLVNFAAFQVGWFACVLGAARGRPWLGPAVTAALVALHLWTFEDPAPEALFLAVVLALGLVVDSAEEALGLLHYGPRGRIARFLCPMWIAALWVLFGTAFHRSLGWIVGEPLLAVPLGGLGGVLSYLAGERLGALRFGAHRRRSLLGVGLVWAAVMPLLAWLAARPPWNSP